MPQFPCSGPIKATLRVSSGDLRVVAESRTTVEVDVQPGSSGEAARTAAANTRVEMNGAELLIEVPQARGFVIRRTPPLNITVRLPLDSGLIVRSASADIACSGRFGTSSVKSASGDLRVDHIAGDFERHAASGDTFVDGIDGDANVVHASGDLRIGAIGGDASARSASGDVSIDSVGGSATLSTASGDIAVRHLSTGTAKIHAASGDVTVGVAEGTAVWLDLNSASGDTRSDLSVSPNAPAGTDLNLQLRVRTASGDITVRRSLGHPVDAVMAQAPVDMPPTDAV
jgi:DUF4097 and DUF4098 domain-containing protein YvlB